MIGLRWVFRNPVTLVTHELEVNPKDGPDRERNKNITHKSTLAPDGQTLVTQGLEEPETFEWSGWLYTEAQYNALEDWYELNHQIEVTDDLGRTWTVLITKYTAKRAWAVTHPWRHEWSMSALKLTVP